MGSDVLLKILGSLMVLIVYVLLLGGVSYYIRMHATCLRYARCGGIAGQADLFAHRARRIASTMRSQEHSYDASQLLSLLDASKEVLGAYCAQMIAGSPDRATVQEVHDLSERLREAVCCERIDPALRESLATLRDDLIELIDVVTFLRPGDARAQEQPTV